MNLLLNAVNIYDISIAFKALYLVLQEKVNETIPLILYVNLSFKNLSLRGHLCIPEKILNEGHIFSAFITDKKEQNKLSGKRDWLDIFPKYY